MLVNEVFLSINGETTTTGLPTTFIRMTGCNLRCWGGCDTTYAYDEGEDMTYAEIIKKVNDLGCPRVLLTGGEPLLNERQAMGLLAALVEDGYADISVETNGSVELSEFISAFPQVRFIMDLKPPTSKMSNKMCLSNLELLGEDDEVKVVVGDRGDFEWALDVLENMPTDAHVLFSTVFGKLEPKVLVEWLLDEQLFDCRVQLQIHKVIWSPSTKSV